MRVAIVTGSFPKMPCGVGDYSERLASGLAERKVEVDVLTTDVPAVAATGGGVRVWPLIERWRTWEAGRVWRFLRQRKPDVVHIQHPTQGYGNGWLPSLVPLLARLAGASVVETWHEGFRREQALSVVVRRLAGGPVIVVRPDFRKRLYRPFRWLLRERSCRYVASAAAIPRVVLDDAGRQAVRERYGVRAEARLIVFFGFVYRHKGVDLLFDIADPATDHVVIAGPSNVDHAYTAELQARARRDEWQGKATFAGYLETQDAGALLAAADAVVLPFREGGGDWNTSIHGAVDNGTPVVTTSGSARADDVGHGIRYCPIEDVAAMRTALRGTRRRPGPAAASINDWPSIVARHLEIYAEALGRRPTVGAR